MLLPFIAYSFSPYKHVGLQFGYSITDNVNQLNIREAGQIAHLNPHFIYSGFLELDYIGEFSLINFDFTNLLVANDVKIAKKILLPGIGNNTAIYIDLHNFYTPSYEQYRITDVIAGHSLNVYLGNHLLSSDTKVRYKYYLLDSLNNYLEPSVNIGVGIPLPYLIFTPRVGIGFRKYLDEFVMVYTAEPELYCPLTLDFSISFGMNFLSASQPQTSYITPLIYADDPFFEEENINHLAELRMSVIRTLAKKRVYVEAELVVFHKGFHEMENLERLDKGLQFSIQFTKFIGDNLGLHISGHSHLNMSTIEDFDYMKNEIALNLELIF